MTAEGRVRELNDRAVEELVRAHAARADEPLVLAVRFAVGIPGDVGLFEVLADFPGGASDELFDVSYEPAPHLRILGTLRLLMGSPEQVEHAIAQRDPALDAVRAGPVVFDDGSDQARAVRHALGL